MCDNRYLFNKIKSLPAVQPEQKTGRWEHDGGHFANRWIPVSERLPDTSMKYVIFTLYTPAWHDVTDELSEEGRDFPEETKVVCGSVDVYSDCKRFWCWEEEYVEATIKNEHIKEYTGEETFITAWMPMPEPYTKENE